MHVGLLTVTCRSFQYCLLKSNTGSQYISHDNIDLQYQYISRALSVIDGIHSFVFSFDSPV